MLRLSDVMHYMTHAWSQSQSEIIAGINIRTLLYTLLQEFAIYSPD